MVKWYNVALPRLSRGFDYLWPHTRVNTKKRLLKLRFFVFRKQTTLISGSSVRRRHAFAPS